MKRYRVLTYDFDTRANILNTDIKDDWEPELKAQWENNKNQIKEGLIAEFGAYSAFAKIRNFIDLGAYPISIIAFHNKFLHQARRAFVIGAYYPALTSACTLGERILNQLILHLRDYFKATPQYTNVYRKNSFDDWDLGITTLDAWKILLPDVVVLFRKLKDIRHRSIHFNPETDTNDRELSLNAILILSKIIQSQFSAFGTQPWFIEGIPGATYIKRQNQEDPFVKEIILPNCYLVGHLHTLENSPKGWVVHDNHEYENIEISDQEFAELLKNRGKTTAPNKANSADAKSRAAD